MTVEQVKLPDGSIVTVRPEDVVRDADGNAVAMRPRGHGLGSEGDYGDYGEDGATALGSAEKWKAP
jgi:hypothetical protein